MNLLLLSVGNTHAPGVVSIKHHRPDKVVFFVSQESNKLTLPKILKEAPVDCRAVVLEPGEEFDFPGSYQGAVKAIRAALSENPTTLWVDITGGTKLMTAALALAASDHQLEFAYVDGDRDKKTGRVRSGTERVRSSMPNPLVKFRVRVLERLRHTWNDWRFDEVQDQADELLRREDLMRHECQLFEALRSLAKALQAWEAFDHSRAARHLEGALPTLDVLCSVAYPSLEPFLGQMQALQKTLGRIVAEREDGEATLHDLLANARRRAEEEHYEEALARLVRALELFVRLEALKHGHDLRALTGVGAFLRRFGELLPQHPLAADTNERTGKFKKYTNARNFSILAHGSSPVWESTYRELEEHLASKYGLKPVWWDWPELPLL